MGRRSSVGLGGAVALSGLLGVSCVAEQRGFDSPSPNRRLDAIAEARDLDDTASLEALVRALESPDLTERTLAIWALEAREGETYGYRAGDPIADRILAVRKWEEHVRNKGGDGSIGGVVRMSTGAGDGEAEAGADE